MNAIQVIIHFFFFFIAIQQYEDKGSSVPPIVLHPALKDVVVVPSRGPNSRPTEVCLYHFNSLPNNKF